MGEPAMSAMRVRKVYNNNVVLAARADGEEFILLGRSIGFNVRPGQDISSAHVERLFVGLSGRDGDGIARWVAQMSIEDVQRAREIVEEGRARFSLPLHDRVLLPLADHLRFAIERAQGGLEIDNPLEFEVPTFYPAETALARWAIGHVERTTGVVLPPGEAVMLAMHFVNAQLGGEDMSKAVGYTRLFGRIVDEIVVSRDGRPIEDPLVIARLITHLRYLIVRNERGLPPNGVDLAEVAVSFRASHPVAWETAMRVAGLLSDQIAKPLGEDELLYIALHVARAQMT